MAGNQRVWGSWTWEGILIVPDANGEFDFDNASQNLSDDDRQRMMRDLQSKGAFQDPEQAQRRVRVPAPNEIDMNGGPADGAFEWSTGGASSPIADRVETRRLHEPGPAPLAGGFPNFSQVEGNSVIPEMSDDDLDRLIAEQQRRRQAAMVQDAQVRQGNPADTVDSGSGDTGADSGVAGLTEDGVAQESTTDVAGTDPGVPGDAPKTGGRKSKGGAS